MRQYRSQFTIMLVYNGQVLQSRTFVPYSFGRIVGVWTKMYALDKKKQHEVYIHVQKHKISLIKKRLKNAA